jgi:tRNA U34 5-methylaminomethyl-2-thiouridine-forming methyltransferase MnmC
MHVFIKAGWRYLLEEGKITGPISIFEMGFGTGLNAFLTAIEAEERKQEVVYTAVEAFPLTIEEAATLNYTGILDHKELFEQLHTSEWNQPIPLTPYFTLHKLQTDLAQLSAGQQYHLVYYDAFAPSAQPELWTKEIFEKLYAMLQPGGVLVTYCSKGDVRRAMIAAGFQVEKLPGPPGKREMVRARVI